MCTWISWFLPSLSSWYKALLEPWKNTQITTSCGTVYVSLCLLVNRSLCVTDLSKIMEEDTHLLKGWSSQLRWVFIACFLKLRWMEVEEFQREENMGIWLMSLWWDAVFVSTLGNPVSLTAHLCSPIYEPIGSTFKESSSAFFDHWAEQVFQWV